MQLFSTVSVQYNTAWPKDLVHLMRKVGGEGEKWTAEES